MATKFTDLYLRKLTAPADGQREVADADAKGLSIRVSKDGTKAFRLTYHIDGERRRATIGRYPGMSLADARARRHEVFAAAAKGVDAYAAEQPRRAVSFAFDTCVERFIEEHVKRKNRRPETPMRILRKEFTSVWGDRDVRTIQKSDVRGVLDTIYKRGTPIAANRALVVLRSFFNWLINTADHADKLPYSPCDRLPPPAKENSRERVLTDKELGTLWVAAETLSFPYAQFFKLLTLLGQRRTEIASMRWNEVDLDKGVWSIPSRTTKNGKPHVLPLPRAAVDILNTTPKLIASPYVFPSARGASAHITGYSVMKRRIDAVARDVADWQFHDLRRTQATVLAELRVAQNITDLIENHRNSGGSQVAGIYNRYAYLSEMREALELWTVHVEHQCIPKAAAIATDKRAYQWKNFSTRSSSAKPLAASATRT